jgi:hypothetical protein
VLVRFRNSHTIVHRSNYVELSVEKGLEFWTQEDTLPFIGDDEEWNADSYISLAGPDDLYGDDLEHFSDDEQIPEPLIGGESDTPIQEKNGETQHLPIGGEIETPVQENTVEQEVGTRRSKRSKISSRKPEYLYHCSEEYQQTFSERLEKISPGLNSEKPDFEEVLSLMTDTIESLNALAEETSDKRLEDELAAKAKQPGVKGKDASLELELHQLFNKHKALRPVKMSIEEQRNANIHRGRMMH